jgi:hypothetical protein
MTGHVMTQVNLLYTISTLTILRILYLFMPISTIGSLQNLLSSPSDVPKKKKKEIVAATT